MNKRIEAIQEQLREAGADGWLLYDHHGRDPIAYRVLDWEMPASVSRRWYYWVPAEGEPVGLASRIEPHNLDSLAGPKRHYSSWREQRKELASILSGAEKIAMQYSPNCMIPYVSLVDGGTIDLVRSLGKEVVSSAALVQHFEARWTDTQFEMHQEAGRRIDSILDEAFELIGARIRSAGEVFELEIAEFIRARFREKGLAPASGPTVAVNENSGDPHYHPDEQRNSPIKADDFVLIDLWGKLTERDAVYYDITWTGCCSAQPTDKVQQVFEAVTGARDHALAFINDAVKAGRNPKGFEADDAARQFLDEAGWGDRFVHRLGHSIGYEIHGNGANLDNFETHDDRPLVAGTCFSIEPGVYLPEFGVRSEIDCWVSAEGAQATGRVQREIVRIQV